MKNFLLPAALALGLVACTKTGLSPGWNDSPSGFDGLGHEMIVLGERLNDPYTVENITKSLSSLYPTKADRVEIEPTDLYVRFLPADERQYDMLEQMGVQMLDHPMDFRIVKEGDYYHDPELPEGDITWQYAVVPIDFEAPQGIRYEVLDKCYIAENAPSVKSEQGIDWSAVERESYRLTGNEDMLLTPTKASYDPTRPEGRICIVDDALGPEPFGVAGVRVACNSFVKVCNAYTDADGYYKMDREYCSDVRYRLVFKNTKGFAIGFNLLLTPASNSTLGSNPPSGISVTVDSNSERKLFTRCVVNNAGYEYYNKCKVDGYSIKTPPSNLRIWLFQNLSRSSTPMLQQGALVDNSVLSDYLGPYMPLLKMFLPDITLGLDTCNDYASVYNTAIHELSHASHYMQAGKTFWDAYIHFILTSFVTSGWTVYGTGTEEGSGFCAVGEIWAFFQQTVLYRERYGGMSSFGGSYWFSPQILVNLDSRGIDRFKIFKALTPQACSLDAFQDELISLYPESKTIINQAFNRYN